MTQQEAIKILQMQNASIIAPAGHGKTEMIANLMEYSEGRWLLLTHTNAGVDALEKRMKKRNIPRSKFKILTIAAFCMKWCNAYKNTAGINTCLSPFEGNYSREYFNQLYNGAKKIFSCVWAEKVLANTYSGIIIDEYQDCTVLQQEIFCTINNILPIIVLGDPMQGIFDFDDTLVDWKHIPFEEVKIPTFPWRWQYSNRELGEYLTKIREGLLPILDGKVCNLHIEESDYIKIIAPKLNYYDLMSDLNRFSSTVFITKWKSQQLNFSHSMPGIFQFNETQECKTLFDYALQFDEKENLDLALSALEFASKCATNLKELQSYKKQLLKGQNFNFTRIKKHKDFGGILSSGLDDDPLHLLISMLEWIQTKQTTFKIWRPELFKEMLRSIKIAKSKRISIYEAAKYIRSDKSLRKNYISRAKFLSSRTLLSKGLEFDCVIIDMNKTPLSAKEFYVAMTRAMKKIYIISTSADFSFNK